MGMFDDIRCRYPLSVPGANDLDYQTKDTPAQYMDRYEIREDGTLWHESYDTEDRSDPTATGLLRLAGCATRVNQRWGQIPFTGEIRFYKIIGKDGWIEFSSYFLDGKIQQVNLIEHRER